MTEFIKIFGDVELSHIINNMISALGVEELGKVYSTGANQGMGNYEWYVQSHEKQAFIHQERWQHDVDAVDEFEPKAVEIFSKVLQDIANGFPAMAFTRKVVELQQMILKFMQEYPPPPSNSRYVRTNTLHHSWTSEIFI